MHVEPGKVYWLTGLAGSGKTTLGQMLYLRPHNRLEGFRNCYLVGGGTHPGSGLPVIYEGARISTRLLMADLGLQPVVDAGGRLGAAKPALVD